MSPVFTPWHDMIKTELLGLPPQTHMFIHEKNIRQISIEGILQNAWQVTIKHIKVIKNKGSLRRIPKRSLEI